MNTGQGGSGGERTRAEAGSGSDTHAAGFARLPRWARIVVPIAVVAIVIAIVIVIVIVIIGIVSTNGERTTASDPETAAQAACEPAAEAQLERRGHTEIDVSEQAAVTQQADGGYRVQGTVTFVEDDETHHADVRCIVRMDEGGAVKVVSVRFND